MGPTRRVSGSTDGTSSDDPTDGLSPAARRYLAPAIAPETVLAPAARLEMWGRIKIGRRLNRPRPSRRSVHGDCRGLRVEPAGAGDASVAKR
jgi:hypothetical protein